MGQSENMVRISNQNAYFCPNVLGVYTADTLMRAEALALLKYQPYFAQKRVLDIGIGAGRTTIYLAPLATEYVGIDFSPTFIDHVNRTMPHVSAKLGDIRDLSDFDSAHFDFVMASFNVIDFVSHDDRLKALNDVCRVLKPGGVFVFASHNRSFELIGAAPKLETSKNPARQLLRFMRWIRRVRNYRKLREHWASTDEYSIVADIGNDFSTLHYYIDQGTQRQQLAKSGFSTLEVFDIFGDPVAPGVPERKSAYLTYVAQKSSSDI